MSGGGMTDRSSRFGPAVKRVLADEIVDQLRDAIVTGALQPGQRLLEDELAGQMQVSRGPVREAFVKLEREGLVTIERYKGARVAELYRDDIEQVFSLRLALERLAVESACKRGTDDDFAQIASSLDRYAEAGSPEAIAEIDLSFHDGVVAAAHHLPLSRAWEGLRTQILSFLTTRMSLRRDYSDEWEPDHRRILDLIRRGEAEQATAAITHHIEASYTRVIDAMEHRE
jgi:DNA-binding GntR family transcriptional regulator